MRAVDRPLATPLRATDWWFRAWGVATLLLLGVTAVMLGFDAGNWRVAFALAHLAALLALVPLGLVLASRALIESRAESEGWGGALALTGRRYSLEARLVAVALVAVAISLANFPDGERAMRTAANLITVAIVVVLVVRYLRWSGWR